MNLVDRLKQNHYTITDGRMHLAEGSTVEDPRWIVSTAFYNRKVMGYIEALKFISTLREANPGRVYEVLGWDDGVEARLMRE